jgi:hypothetical protein
LVLYPPEGRRYTEDDFNRVIEIKERERFRVKLFMDVIDQRSKTLVICATQEHALAVRDLGEWATRARIGLERLTSNNEIAGFKFATVGVIYAVLLAFAVIAVWENLRDGYAFLTSSSGLSLYNIREKCATRRGFSFGGCRRLDEESRPKARWRSQ